MFRSATFSVRLAVFIVATGVFARGQATSPTSDDESFLEKRFHTASRADAEQPHWIAPLFTVTPRLLEQVRFDILQQNKSGFSTTNYGGGKGLELIPTEHAEITISTLPYIVHSTPRVHDGIGDMSFLFKYRLAAGNEERGNYIVSAFLGATVPTGTFKNGASGAVITPTLAGGKGWGNFDFQTTFGVAIPTDHMNTLGIPLIDNTAFQYRIFKKFWPEVEVNCTFWTNGFQAGNKQVFLSPGLIAGKFHLWKRLGVTIGGGVQIAATHFHTQDHNYLFSVRFPF